MNFVIDNWALILLTLVSGTALLWPALSGTSLGASVVAPTGAVQLMNREKAVVIDVCGPNEYAAGHVAGAKHVPLAELTTRLPGLVKNKTTPLVMVCASGMRSRSAVGVARKLGYEKAFSLAGGLKAWREANLPVEKA